MHRGTPALLAGLLATAVVAGALRHEFRTHAASHSPRLTATDRPTMLANSVGLSQLSGLTREGSSSAPLWADMGGRSPFTPSQLGLVGGLYQIWTSSAAIAQYGPLGHGLPLPLPARFVRTHPGQPLEVYVRILKFNNRRSPHTLLANPDYNFNSARYKGGPVPIAQTVSNGWAYAMPNQDHNGETDYVFQWAHGDYWNQVTVLGHMSATQAVAVAQHVAQ